MVKGFMNCCVSNEIDGRKVDEVGNVGSENEGVRQKMGTVKILKLKQTARMVNSDR
jgi:hypothetical protein